MTMVKSARTWLPFLVFSLVACSLGLAGVAIFGGDTGYGEFLAQWLFFTALSGAILLLAGILARHPDPNLFTALMLGSVMLRIMLCLVFLLVYTRVTQPQDNGFLLWFFLLYAAYTVHEVRSLSRMVTRSGS